MSRTNDTFLQTRFCLRQFKAMGASTFELSIEALKLISNSRYRLIWYKFFI